MANNKSNGEYPPVCASGENHQYTKGRLKKFLMKVGNGQDTYLLLLGRAPSAV